MKEHQDPIIFIVPGDLHLTEPNLENHRVARWVVEQANGLVRPDFVQFIGDNVQDATEEQFGVFNELRCRLVAPHHILVGDHDVTDGSCADVFRAHLGETYGSTSLRGFRLIRLDTQQARPVGLGTRQIEWLREELDSASAAGERPVIFQHNYPYQIWEDFSGPGVDDWRGIVQSHRIAAIVCGHTHYWQVANDGRNVFIATRSIGDPEGGLAGYCIGYLKGDDLAFVYRTVQEAGPIVMITHPRETLMATCGAHVVRGEDEIRVRTWSDEPVTEVIGRIDGGPSFSLLSSGDGRWSASLDGDELTKGEHTLEVKACVESRLRGRHLIRFMVDQTGRYTAVPGVHPHVTQTAFC